VNAPYAPDPEAMGLKVILPNDSVAFSAKLYLALGDATR